MDWIIFGLNVWFYIIRKGDCQDQFLLFFFQIFVSISQHKNLSVTVSWGFSKLFLVLNHVWNWQFQALFKKPIWAAFN